MKIGAGSFSEPMACQHTTGPEAHTVKVFISWSGKKSRALAEIFHDWIPAVIQGAKPYFTLDDVAKGARWSTEIAKELSESKVGIICLTSESLVAPWVMFEAGALSRDLDKSKVCPILFQVGASDITGPLLQFQASNFERADIRRLVGVINSELGEDKLASEVLKSVFDMWWPKLKERVEKVLGEPDEGGGESLRSERDMLEEVLALTRSMRRPIPQRQIAPEVIVDLTERFAALVHRFVEMGSENPLFAPLADLFPPIEVLVNKSPGLRRYRDKLRLALDNARADLIAPSSEDAESSESNDISDEDIPF